MRNQHLLKISRIFKYSVVCQWRVIWKPTGNFSSDKIWKKMYSWKFREPTTAGSWGFPGFPGVSRGFLEVPGGYRIICHWWPTRYFFWNRSLFCKIFRHFVKCNNTFYKWHESFKNHCLSLKDTDKLLLKGGTDFHNRVLFLGPPWIFL